MQALILAGGEGTRLRPLTYSLPKPVIRLVDRPALSHMIGWLSGHGVDDVVLACGFLADAVRDTLGDGAQLGVRIRYVEEPEPLGTGGALRYAQDLLDERFLMLNGDVLTDIDLTAQLEQHERTGARATLALVAVEDPSAYGLVRLNEDRSVRGFLEKPAPEEIDTDLINAGAYVLERDVIDVLPPAGVNASIERDAFPKLVGAGLYGAPAAAYWRDLGTPASYLQATADLLAGEVRAERPPVAIAQGARVSGQVEEPVVIEDGCEVAAGAQVGPASVLAAGASVGEGAEVARSVVFEGAAIGAGAVLRDCIVGPAARVGEGAQLTGAVLGAEAEVAAGARLEDDARVAAAHMR